MSELAKINDRKYSFQILIKLKIVTVTIPDCAMGILNNVAAGRTVLIILYVGINVPYTTIFLLTFFSNISRTYEEAAAIDGAGKWQQITRITIPMLKPTIIMMTLLSIGRIFYSDFGLFYQVPQNSGALYPVTNTIDTYVYRGLLELGNISLSAAAGLYQSVIGFILVLGTNLWVRKIDPDNALF